MEKNQRLQATKLTLGEIATALSDESMLKYVGKYGRLPKPMELIFLYVKEKSKADEMPLFDS